MSRVQRRHYRDSAGAVHDVEIAPTDDGRYRGTVDGRPTEFDVRRLAPAAGGADVVLLHDGGRRRAVVVRDGDQVHVHAAGRTWTFRAVVPRPGGARGAGGGAIAEDPFAASPMTGVVRRVLVAPGEPVAAGATLFVVEAMKMEFAVPAPRDVVVDEVRAKDGDRVDIQQVVVTFRTGPAGAGA